MFKQISKPLFLAIFVLFFSCPFFANACAIHGYAVNHFTKECSPYISLGCHKDETQFNFKGWIEYTGKEDIESYCASKNYFFLNDSENMAISNESMVLSGSMSLPGAISSILISFAILILTITYFAMTIKGYSMEKSEF